MQFKRSMLVSYLDEDLLVVRDGAGKADILERVSIKPTPPYTDALVEPADGLPRPTTRIFRRIFTKN